MDETRGPTEAADGLSRRLLTGGQCTHCKQKIVLNSKDQGCRWRRLGDRWERACIPDLVRYGLRGSGRTGGMMLLNPAPPATPGGTSKMLTEIKEIT